MILPSLLGELGEHVGGHSGQVVLRLPAPVGGGFAVVDGAGPGVGDGLAEVRCVANGEARPDAGDLGGDLRGREADPGEVVGGADLDLLGGGLHQLQRGANGVGHVHHGQRGIGTQEARVPILAESVVEDVHGVVGSAAAGWGHVADQAGVAQTAHVEPVAAVVIVAEQLAGELGDAIHGGGVHDAILRGEVAGSVRAEGGDGGGPEHARDLVRHARVEHVDEPLQVDVPRRGGVFLAGGGEQCGEVVDGVDLVLAQQALREAGREHIGGLADELRVSSEAECFAVGRDDECSGGQLEQGGHEFGAELAAGTENEDTRHDGLAGDVRANVRRRACEA